MKIPDKIDVNEVKAFVDQFGPDTKIYIGCDSEKFKKEGKWWAEYTTVVVVHMNGKNGARMFGAVVKEPDYDQNKKRPAMRLMNECYRATELYNEVIKVIDDKEIEIHLDVNPAVEHGSSCVVEQAIGYVRGVCGITPKIKSEAFAASYGADRFREIYGLVPRYIPPKTRSKKQKELQQ